VGKGIFITGTDTGVGKTLVSCGLAALLKKRGYKVGVMKPAETGCAEKNGQLFPQDAFYLQQASGCDDPLERICPYRLWLPLAPSVAAAKERLKIDVSLIINLYNEISSVYDVTLVEGAGGLLVPLLPRYTYADLARAMNLPLLVVAANRLGAINHLLLTLEHASCRGLNVVGYILNQVTADPSLARETNASALRQLTSVPCLGEIPHIDDLENKRSSLESLFGEKVDPQRLEAMLR
jgi:dethiobiotin synthetase